MQTNKYMFGNMSGMSAMGFTYIFRQKGSFLMVQGFENVSAASLVLGIADFNANHIENPVCRTGRSAGSSGPLFAGRKRRKVGKSGKSGKSGT